MNKKLMRYTIAVLIMRWSSPIFTAEKWPC